MVNVDPDIVIGKPQDIGSFIPLQTLKRQIEYWGNVAGLPIIVEIDKARFGKGWETILSSTEDCVAIYHKEHRKDYNSVVLIQSQQGIFSFLTTYLGGRSKNFVNTQMPTDNFFGRATVNSAKKAYQSEKIYYNLVFEVVAKAVESIPEEEESYSQFEASYTEKQTDYQEQTTKKAYTPPKRDEHPPYSNREYSQNKSNTYQNSSNSNASKYKSDNCKEDYNHSNGYNLQAVANRHPKLYSQLMTNPIYLQSEQPKLTAYRIGRNVVNYFNKKFPGKRINIYGQSKKTRDKELMFKLLYNTNEIKCFNIILVFDNTIFGGCKDGFVITEEFFYSHDICDAPKSKPLTSVKDVYMKDGKVYVDDTEIPLNLFDLEAKQMVYILNYCISMALGMSYWIKEGDYSTVNVKDQSSITSSRVDGSYRLSNKSSPDSEYVFFECVYCGHKYRAKKGRGMIEFTCVDCGNQLRKQV